MEYIDTLLIMEDDLDEDQEDGDLGEFGESSMTGDDNNKLPEQGSSREPTEESTNNSTTDWCVCGRCRPMPQCCKLKKCITLHVSPSYVLMLMFWRYASEIEQT
jgi:hypothetical protein